MLWSELYDGGQKPSDHQINDFVNTPLWDDLANQLQQTYHVQPKMAYSCCSMDNGSWKGWNVKYKKSGKSLCTLYPKQGYFTALIAVGASESVEAELLIPFCDEYTQQVYRQAVFSAGYKPLAIDVTSKDILDDVETLIALRAGSR